MENDTDVPVCSCHLRGRELVLTTKTLSDSEAQTAFQEDNVLTVKQLKNK